MNRFGVLCAAGALTGGIFLSAQTQTQLPEPRRGFGASVTGAVATTVVDPLMAAGPVSGAPRPNPRPDTVWGDSGSAIWRNSARIIGSPDGARIFTPGLANRDGNFDGGREGSSGIWVFDATTGALIDHWSPVTAYGWLSISRDEVRLNSLAS